MTQPVQKQPGYYIQPGCECGLQTRDHWAASWNLGWMSKIRRKDVTFRTRFCLSPRNHQKWRTARWNLGLGLRAVEPGLRVKTECPKSYIFSPDFGCPAQVPTCSPVVSCLQTTLTTWLYIVTWLLLDRLSHLIGGGSKTCFGPKSG